MIIPYALPVCLYPISLKHILSQTIMVMQKPEAPLQLRVFLSHFLTIFVKQRLQLLHDRHRFVPFDVVAVEHGAQFPVF